jgi:hypothetical protein
MVWRVVCFADQREGQWRYAMTKKASFIVTVLVWFLLLYPTI